MNADSLLNFYNTLFGIEIAIFGIISAVIFVFVQLVFSNYSYKHIGHILKNRWILLYFILSTIDLLITAAGSYFLSLGRHDLIPNIYFYSNIIVANQYYSLVCLILIFISIVCFVTLIVRDITYLQPHRAIFLLLQSIDYLHIRDFLWKKYRLEPPFRLKVRISRYLFDDLKKSKESKKAREARILREEKESDKELKDIESKIKSINKRVENAEDPLLPVRDIMIQFIRRSDLTSLEEASSLIEKITGNFFSGLPGVNKVWIPEEGLAQNYTKYLIELMDTVLEVADKEGLETAKQIILKSSYSIANSLFENGNYSELDKIEEWWQKIADHSIGKSSLVFQTIINFYQDIGPNFFKLLKDSKSKEPGEIERMLENLFRYIGWLGERLLIKLPFEESPLFTNYEYSTEYDDYYNCLMSFSDLYDRDQPNLYPLIYFDALIVVMKRLVKVYKSNKNYDLDNNIFSIAYAFSSFAENAIQAGNGRGASLAALRIKETYSELKSAGLDKEANDVIKLLVRLGILAVSNKEKLGTADFMGRSIDDWVIEELGKSNEDIDDEVMESYIKTMGGDHDTRWGFITKLGIRMGRNFGLMFDSVTGKTYTEDDPRRR